MNDKVIDNSKSIEWQSSNPKVATVNDSGTVRGKGAGKAVVSAKIGIYSDSQLFDKNKCTRSWHPFPGHVF